MSHCSTMPLVPGQTTKHLRKLRANPEMLAFLCGFDTPDGKWSSIKAHEALGKGGAGATSRQSKPRAGPSTPSQSAAPVSMSQVPTPSAGAPRRSAAPRSMSRPPSAPVSCEAPALCATPGPKRVSKSKARESPQESRPTAPVRVTPIYNWFPRTHCHFQH